MHGGGGGGVPVLSLMGAIFLKIKTLSRYGQWSQLCQLGRASLNDLSVTYIVNKKLKRSIFKPVSVCDIFQMANFGGVFEVMEFFFNVVLNLFYQ